MADLLNGLTVPLNRRSFVEKGLMATGAATMVPGLTVPSLFAKAGSQEPSRTLTSRGSLSTGDAALIRFAAAAEILESDFWVQYNELGGIPDSELPGGTGNKFHTAKLANLDADFPQYVHDNTDDELAYFTFLNAYLVANGAEPANLDAFRTLEGSTASGVNRDLIGKRLTNLTQLTLDTSWWTRYRSDSHNPDLDPNFVFPQAVPDLAAGHTQPSPEPITTCTPVSISKPLPTRRRFTCRPSNKVATASTPRWRGERAAWKCCGS
jgi:hypothetical protein